jgi:type IV fimbrial biogenesis protein FimT
MVTFNYANADAMTLFNVFSMFTQGAKRDRRWLGALVHRQSGLTAIELMVVIAIVGVLTTVAVPSMLSTMNAIKRRSAIGLVLDDLNRAKGEAIKRNARVLMCVRNTAGTDCASNSNWQSGWVICVEDSASVNHCLAGTSTDPNPLVVRPALNTALTLVKASTTATDPIRFSANGTGTAATLTLGGTWSGATSSVVSVAATGGISKQ